jgi:hypothetical protein
MRAYTTRGTNIDFLSTQPFTPRPARCAIQRSIWEGATGFSASSTSNPPCLRASAVPDLH